ncbi:AsmA family protein [Pseudodesulfovibrio indicus]|uniref:AsmA protein n=1 Tax=Pseudodesulfovibrio indicus TaxID=1716143 RepID=A0A126QP20_9BACT|nr:AsmA family protein [Pseudodesulfovibrio indicus]AMK11654.1 hypothetical protein AWY79_11280 [Pseudodesulfovibrio indicus]TDT90066.1 AsmA protein [Pseudodesulfovibrio indicus]
MIKWVVRFLVEVLAVVVALLAGGLFLASYYIDTGEFRARFVAELEGVLNRDVTLKGDLDIDIWPRLALVAEDLDIGEAPGFGDGPAAHFDDLSISVRVIPLFSRHVEVDSLDLDGLDAVIVRNGEGLFNWQTLLQGEEKPGVDVSVTDDWTFSIASVEITGAELLFRDERDGDEYRLSGIDIRTGIISLGDDVPFSATSSFSWQDKGVKADIELKGMVRLDAGASLPILSNTSVQAHVYGDFLPDKVEPGEFLADLDVDWENNRISLEDVKASFLGLLAEGDIDSGNLDEGLNLSGHVTVHPFAPRTLIARYAPDMPVKDVDGLNSSALATFIRVTEEGVRFKDLVVTLDDITVRGELGFKGYESPVFDFALRGDTIDLDRYLPLFRTGTPFIWDDYNLEFFRAFRGSGTVRADGFKVLDTLISDIRLKVAATDKGIDFDAGAIREGMASLGGRMSVAIGSAGAKGEPTLALNAVIDAESQRRGFEFLRQETFQAGGHGRLHLELALSKMACPPEGRSIYIFKHLSGAATLSLGEGKASIKGGSGEPVVLPYAKADVDLKFRPRGPESTEFWTSILSAGVKLRGPGRLETLNATAEGPFTLGLDKAYASGSDMAVSGYLTSPLLPKDAKRMTFAGKVGFDTDKTSVELADGTFQLLETPVTGNARYVGAAKVPYAEGDLAVAGADPRRMIYLLTGKNLRTNDPDALRKASVQTHFRADKDGFTLSELKGDLDGTTIKAHVMGTGWADPQLAFSLAAGSFNLDRYLSPAPAPSLSDVRAGKVPEAPPADLPLEFLRALRLNGKAFFSDFTLAKIRTESLEGSIRASEGVIQVSKVTGLLYGGALNATWKGTAYVERLDTHLFLDVDNMQAGPLMADLAKREYVRGETDLRADLTSTGGTDDETLDSLSGKVTVRINNGSFKFTGYDAPAKPVDEGRGAMIGKTQVAKPSPRTVFKTANVEADVDKGVFTLTTAQLDAPPVLKAQGHGSFSLGDDTIDISIRNDFVAVPSVTLRLTGKLTDPKVDVPTGKIVNDTVFNILSLPKKSFDFFRDLF